MAEETGEEQASEQLWRQLQNDSDAGWAAVGVDKKIRAAIASGETPPTEETAAIRKEIRELLNWHPIGTVTALNKLLPPDQQIDVDQTDFHERAENALDALLGESKPHLQIVDVPGTMVDTAQKEKYRADKGKEFRTEDLSQPRIPLIEEVLAEMDINISELPHAERETEIPKGALRNNPYILIRIPELDKSILVCEEKETKMRVIFTADKARILAEFFGKSSTELDMHPEVRGVKWQPEEKFVKRNLKKLLESDSVPPRKKSRRKKPGPPEITVHPETGEENGVVMLKDPQTGLDREAIGVAAYARSREEVNLTSLLDLIRRAQLQATGIHVRFKTPDSADRKSTREISNPVPTFWKDEVDPLIPIRLERNGTAMENGELVTSVASFISRHPEAGRHILPELIRLAKINPLARLGRRTGPSKGMPIYRENELLSLLTRADELRGIRRPDDKGYLKVPVEGEPAEVEAINVYQLANMLLETEQIEDKKSFTTRMRKILKSIGAKEIEKITCTVMTSIGKPMKNRQLTQAVSAASPCS